MMTPTILSLAPGQFYRACAMAILYHPETKLVLAGLRSSGGPTNTWQFPQGGIEANQTPLYAAVAEVYEETGISIADVDLIQELPGIYTYLVPDGPTKKHGRGQVQTPFLFKYTGPAKLDDPQDDEFSRLKWMKFTDVIRRTPAFRQPIYEQIYHDFSDQGVIFA